MAISFRFGGSSLCFFSAHLAAHMPYLQRRNEDISEIFNGVFIGNAANAIPGAGGRLIQPAYTFGMDTDHTVNHCFFMGDMNYRVDLGIKTGDPKAIAHKESKPPRESLIVRDLIAQGKHAEALACDQLHYAMRDGKVLADWNEAPILFQPTFKVARLGVVAPPGGWEADGDSEDDGKAHKGAAAVEMSPPSVTVASPLAAAAASSASSSPSASAVAPLASKFPHKKKARCCAATPVVPPSVIAGALGASRSRPISIVHASPAAEGVPLTPVGPGMTGACKYKMKRVPSWCDRILWHSQPAFKGDVDVVSYDAFPEISTSDHKPVAASFVVRTRPSYVPSPALLAPELDVKKSCARLEFTGMHAGGGLIVRQRVVLFTNGASFKSLFSCSP